MRELVTINFRDTVNDDDATAIVRASDNTVALALSLQSDGDVEVFLSPQDANELISALRTAVAEATSSKEGG